MISDWKMHRLYNPTWRSPIEHLAKFSKELAIGSRIDDVRKKFYLRFDGPAIGDIVLHGSMKYDIVSRSCVFSVTCAAMPIDFGGIIEVGL